MDNSSIEFRITSTYHKNKIQFIYGVPVSKGTTKKKSAIDYIKIKAFRNQLPFEPSLGQQWIVKGKSEVKQEVRYHRLYNDISFINPDSIEITLPHTDEGFIRFIANEIDKISEEKARNLWFEFNKKIYSILENGDKEKLLSVKGIGESSADALIEGFKTFANLKYSNWLARKKVPLPVQQRLLKYHTNKSIEVIKNNPYELVTFGMSFSDVDSLALSTFKIATDSDIRLAAAVNQSLKNLCYKRGHTYIVGKNLLVKELSILIGKEFTDKALVAGKKSATYITFRHDNNIFHQHDLLLVETVVAKRIANLTCTSLDDWTVSHESAYKAALSEIPYELTDKQKDAVKYSLQSNISLITGGAGTGKTTVTRAVLRAYYEMGFDITAVALSGRAAMRLHESTGFLTSTIAKFLREEPIVGSKHILVIDEASMVDIASMYRIINHISPDCRLLFVGDPHQLPPIGAGLVLSQLEKVSYINKTHLDIVKRQEASSGIPEYSLAIRNGQVPEKLSTGAIEFHDTETIQVAIELFCKAPKDSMILAATNKTVDSLNEKLQRILNPDSPSIKFEDDIGQWYGYDYRINDPILFTKNNYDAGFQNGSLGVLVNVTQNKTEGTLGVVRLIDSGEEIQITTSILDSMNLGYAITLHKAQGSQFKNIITVLDKTPMVDRSWLYTAVTRSEEKLHIVGSIKRFIKAISSESSFNQRNAHFSWLVEQYIDKHLNKDIEHSS